MPLVGMRLATPKDILTHVHVPVIQWLNRQPNADQRAIVSGQHRPLLDQLLELFGIHPALELRVMQADQRLAANARELEGGPIPHEVKVGS